MNEREVSTRARRVAAALEPVAGQVYFSPECHANYEALGFGPSPGEFGGVAGPEMESYFSSRGSVMGQVPGAVIAAAFGVFNPVIVEKLVERAWQKVDAHTICQARDDGAIAQLRRILGDRPDDVEYVRDVLARAAEGLEPYGKPIYADYERLLGILTEWGTAIRAAKGYPASGPHDLAELADR
ncbi:helix-turn-helix domain-containing protein [Mycolicibacterium wolinskyi]|uniref:helix-turn-helix domain-containing protein n=1 Tax=Mycolicibacterium wolinskyi TaxID=59750 RepID=UPI00391767D5